MEEFESISFDFVSLACEVSKHVGSESNILFKAHRDRLAIIEWFIVGETFYILLNQVGYF